MKLLDGFFTGNERSNKVKKNFIASLGIKIISIAITFLLVPVTLGYVSDELYGIWLILSSLLMMIQYFDIGFTLGLKNKLTESVAINDKKRSRELVSTTYLMLIIIFIPLCIILEFITPYIQWTKFFNISNIYNDEIIGALRIMFMCMCMQMIVNTLVSVLSAYQRTAIASLFPVLGNLISLIVIFFLSKYASPSLTKLAFAISSMPVLVLTLASFYLYKTTYKDISPSFAYFRLDLVKDIFGLGSKFFLIQIQVIVLYQAANILISNVSDPIDVTNYNIAYKYLNISLMLFNILLTPLWPAFTDAYVKKDFVWMKKIYSKLTLILLLIFCMVFVMVVISPIVYKLWIGNNITIPFAMTLAVAFFVIINSWDSLHVILINGIGTIKLQTYITLIGLFFNIPLSLFLGSYLGAIGVILSMTIITAIYAAVFTIQVKKLLNNTAHGIWCS